MSQHRFSPPSAGGVKLAVGFWLVLAAVVFNVTFDRQVRRDNYAFVASQLMHVRQGLPVATINEGFRPYVRAAAGRTGLWLVLIATAGIVSTAVVARSTR